MTAPLQKAGAPAANGLPLKSGNEAPACPQTTVCFTVDELPLNFTRVIDEASRNEFFLTESWFRNFAQTAVDKDQTIRVYAVARGTTPAAIFFARTAPRANGLASLRTLSSLTNYYSCLFAPHLSEGTGNAKEMLDALALHISRETPRWDAVEIRPMDVDSAHFKALK